MINFFKRLLGISTVPEGWTDDLTIPLPPGHTVTEIVDFVIQCGLQGVPDDETEQRLLEKFCLAEEDAALARDRVYGGIVRAATRSIENRPDQRKDPFACASFDRASKDPSIIATIYPQYANPGDRQA
ncbi:MAG: hypothetical protein K0Q55_135 [Verrucomicrobia bacterium]|jgi:hypothetical protein|nr:hypothetical protein [Verrucomicrobiota bacterium]